MGLNINETILTVPKIATLIGGTTCNLKEGDKLSLLDCFYGMMLPSGNDAAITIANFTGLKLLENTI